MALGGVPLDSHDDTTSQSQAEKNAEVDRMAAIATDTEVRLRPAPTALLQM